MTKVFAPHIPDRHDLYHLRYGRGAIIVAIRQEPVEIASSADKGLDKHVARLFNDRGRRNHDPATEFDNVLSLDEEDGFVRATIQVEHRNLGGRHDERISATIERVIPRQQVTLEIIRECKRIESRRRRFS